MTKVIEGVLFDYGGVMTTPVRDSIVAWLKADRIDPESFSKTLKAWMSRDVDWTTPIHELETGAISATAFERALAAELRSLDGTPVLPDGILRKLFAEMSPDPAMFDLVSDLKALGVTVGLVSNSWGNVYPHQMLQEFFNPIVISESVRLRKPQALIYLHALELLGLPPEKVAFVDDAEPNLIGAEAVGLTAIHHRDAASTRAALARLVPGLVTPLRGSSTGETETS